MWILGLSFVKRISIIITTAHSDSICRNLGRCTSYKCKGEQSIPCQQNSRIYQRKSSVKNGKSKKSMQANNKELLTKFSFY